MTGTIIPLHSDRHATSALAAFDTAAIKLLLSGRVATLSAARLGAIWDRLQVQRVQLVAVIDDLRARPPSGDLQIDAINATLRTEASMGLSYIDDVLDRVGMSSAYVN